MSSFSLPSSVLSSAVICLPLSCWLLKQFVTEVVFTPVEHKIILWTMETMVTPFLKPSYTSKVTCFSFLLCFLPCWKQNSSFCLWANTKYLSCPDRFSALISRKQQFVRGRCVLCESLWYCIWFVSYLGQFEELSLCKQPVEVNMAPEYMSLSGHLLCST